MAQVRGGAVKRGLDSLSNVWYSNVLHLLCSSGLCHRLPFYLTANILQAETGHFVTHLHTLVKLINTTGSVVLRQLLQSSKVHSQLFRLNKAQLRSL